MSVLFIDPHGDDVVLFAAYSALRHKDPPHVLVTHRTVPGEEIAHGLAAIGCVLFFPPYVGKPSRVYAPAWHPDGHAEHNEAEAFSLSFGAPVVPYCTYAPRGQRTRTDNEVPYEPWMVARKLRALSCFVSQIEQESTRPWFTYLLDVREWYA